MATWIGVDVGSAAVKVAVLRSAYRKLFLDAIVSIDVDTVTSVEPLPSPSDETESQEARVSAPPLSQPVSAPLTVPQLMVSPVVEAIRIAIAAAQGGRPAQGEGLGVTVSGSKISVHSITVPVNAQKQLELVLPFELDAEVPFDIEGAVFDFYANPPQKNTSTITALVTVARTEDVRSVIDLIREAAAIEPEWVGAGAFSLAHLSTVLPSSSEDEETIAILDLGTTSTDIVILQKGEPVFARTLSQSVFGVGDARNILARELRVSVAGHRASGGDPPAALYVCGGGLCSRA